MQALEADPGEDTRGIYRPQLLEELGVVYLKMGELDNCLSPEGALICMLPLGFTSVAQTDTEGSQSAAAVLTELLEMQPDNIRAMWLLNIAHMTLGTYPAGVPEDYLVAPSQLRGRLRHRQIRGHLREGGPLFSEHWPGAASWTTSTTTACWTS